MVLRWQTNQSCTVNLEMEHNVSCVYAYNIDFSKNKYDQLIF